MRRGGRALALLLASTPLWASDDEISPGGMPATPVSELPALRGLLSTGDWNERMHAVESLGHMGRPGHPGLQQAADDGDYQVRLAAVHWLGRLGAVSVPDLRRVLRGEPCRIVRITAVHWLGSLGPEALPALEEALGDESSMARSTGRYWQRKLRSGDGRMEVELSDEDDVEDRIDMQTAAYGEDLRGCVHQGAAGKRLLIASAAPRAAASSAPPAPPPPPPPRPVPASPEEEVDPGPVYGPPPSDRPPPDEFPEPPSPSRTEEPPADIPQAMDVDRYLAEGSPEPYRGRGKPESFPPAPGAEYRDELLVRARGLLLDATAGPVPHDALPALLQALRLGDVLLRFRAADELGKMGPAAASAVPDLARALGDKSYRVRSSAALALGNIGADPERSVPALAKALKDRNADVRYGAGVALGRIGTPEAKRAFERYLKEETRRAERATKK